MRYLSAVFVAIAFIQPGPVHAQYVSGNQLLKDLEDPSGRSRALHYVNGVAEGLDFAYTLGYAIGSVRAAKGASDLAEKDLAYICYPDKVTLGQITDVVKQYLVANPADRQKSSVSLISLALTKAFPCR